MESTQSPPVGRPSCGGRVEPLVSGMTMAPGDTGEVRDCRETPCAARAAMSVLWPAFLMATATTGLVFSMIDPTQLDIYGVPLMVEASTAYGIGFLVLWLLFSAGCAMTLLLACAPRRSR